MTCAGPRYLERLACPAFGTQTGGLVPDTDTGTENADRPGGFRHCDLPALRFRPGVGADDRRRGLRDVQFHRHGHQQGRQRIEVSVCQVQTSSQSIHCNAAEAEEAIKSIDLDDVQKLVEAQMKNLTDPLEAEIQTTTSW